MKIISWLFQFSGLGQAQKLVKIGLNLIGLALVAGLLYMLYSGFMNVWHYVAINEPQTKVKIATIYQDYLKKDDSLSTAKINLKQLNYEYGVCDTALYDMNQEVISLKEREKQHQRNNLELKKQLEIYRRDNRVCYKANLFGKVSEVPCSSIKVE